MVKLLKKCFITCHLRGKSDYSRFSEARELLLQLNKRDITVIFALKYREEFEDFKDKTE